MQAPSTQAIKAALNSTELADRSIFYRDHPLFEPVEMGYKRRLALKLAAALQACERNPKDWRNLMVAAIRSKEDNIVPWQAKDSFCTWISNHPSSARRLLLSVSDPSKSPPERLSIFAKGVEASGVPRLIQPGAQLALGSIILMATDPENCPPARTDVIDFTLTELGLDWSARKATAVERYICFLNILDGLIKYSHGRKFVLDNRLEAQGVIWCQKSGWKRSTMAPSQSDAETDILAAKKTYDHLPVTEREAVVSARRGQGRFRRCLLNRWLACSVTNCSNAQILRASHLKPWRVSNNPERLSPANGLLLSPNLDALLDAFLISFSDDGRILISRSLSKEDRLALGLHSDMSLRKWFPDMKPFLNHHRSEFRRLERTNR